LLPPLGFPGPSLYRLLRGMMVVMMMVAQVMLSEQRVCKYRQQ
jgi:hypothetical protein